MRSELNLKFPGGICHRFQFLLYLRVPSDISSLPLGDSLLSFIDFFSKPSFNAHKSGAFNA